MEYVLVIFFSYLSGSIPFGLILTKSFGGKDLREIGSGNIGATNVLRTGNKYLALLTLILDALKGYIPVAICQNYLTDQIQISALFVFLGHIFPVWLKFNGGKGVATYLGVLIAISLISSFIFIFTWIVLTLIFKYSSVSSIFSTLTVLVVNVIRTNVVTSIKPDHVSNNDISLILFIFFVLIVFTHRNNISNLKNKNEKQIKI